MTSLTRRTMLGASLALPGIAHAQSFPARPLRLVVPFPPGGAADITARLVAERMAQQLGQSVIIDNRPGAGGNIAGDVVTRSAPDGHTLFLGGATILCANACTESTGIRRSRPILIDCNSPVRIRS